MNEFKIELIGSSHGEYVGAVIYGFPAGVSVDRDAIAEMMNRRRPGGAFSTARHEEDEVIFENGVRKGITNGEKIILKIYNKDTVSSEYDAIKNIPRPSHADYAAYMKYKDKYDCRGGGAFSGRMTAPLTAAGALCKCFLADKGIRTDARIFAMAGEEDISSDMSDPDFLAGISSKDFPTVTEEASLRMIKAAEDAKKDGDTTGGIIECFITGVPAGTGELDFSSFESVISKYVFAIPSVKGIEFGSGFEGAGHRGSVNNDPFYVKDGTVRTSTNNHGGILGGLASGMPIVFKAAFKPVPTLAIEQKSVDLSVMENTTLTVRGRHDSNICKRAVPVVEAAAACAVCEILLHEKAKKQDFMQM